MTCSCSIIQWGVQVWQATWTNGLDFWTRFMNTKLKNSCDLVFRISRTPVRYFTLPVCKIDVNTSHKQNAQCSGNIKKMIQNKLTTDCFILLFLQFW